AKELTPDVAALLDGVRVLVLNALWFGRPHPTHFNIEEAVEVARSIGAEQTYLTHLTHRVTHAQLLEKLPAGVFPAFDGLEIQL
ncbi:MAG: MBL fold metallo-hydrolase, partial [Longimicrobiales bacterium]